MRSAIEERVLLGVEHLISDSSFFGTWNWTLLLQENSTNFAARRVSKVLRRHHVGQKYPTNVTKRSQNVMKPRLLVGSANIGCQTRKGPQVPSVFS